MRTTRLIAALLACTVLAGCGSAWDKPGNSVDLNGAAASMAERRDMPANVDLIAGDAARFNATRCRPSSPAPAAGGAFGDTSQPLSPGDVVRVSLPGGDAPSGLYRVGSDGTISLDQAGPVPVAGLSPDAAEAAVSARLVARGFYRPGFAHVSLKLTERGAIRVLVAGAVYQPGRVVMNQRSANDREPTKDSPVGDHAIGRALSNALANASGVRPDADIARVAVTRDGRTRIVDLTGLLDGGPADDMLLADGDRVSVPSRGCFQEALARPSPITPPGVRAFISNLTVPAASNASAAIGREATTFPYGTRLLQALVSGNCIGGTQSTNADRWAVLISANPATGRSEVIERRIEELVRRADRDGYNPVILSGDAVACYDSRITNLRDIMRTTWDVLGGGLLKPM